MATLGRNYLKTPNLSKSTIVKTISRKGDKDQKPIILNEDNVGQSSDSQSTSTEAESIDQSDSSTDTGSTYQNTSSSSQSPSRSSSPDIIRSSVNSLSKLELNNSLSSSINQSIISHTNGFEDIILSPKLITSTDIVSSHSDENSVSNNMSTNKESETINDEIPEETNGMNEVITDKSPVNSSHTSSTTCKTIFSAGNDFNQSDNTKDICTNQCSRNDVDPSSDEIPENKIDLKICKQSHVSKKQLPRPLSLRDSSSIHKNSLSKLKQDSARLFYPITRNLFGSNSSNTLKSKSPSGLFSNGLFGRTVTSFSDILKSKKNISKNRNTKLIRSPQSVNSLSSEAINSPDSPHETHRKLPVSFFTGHSRKGKAPLSTKINQDRYYLGVDPDTNSLLLLVLDGHGAFGHQIAEYVKKIFPGLLFTDSFFQTDIRNAYYSSLKALQLLLSQEQTLDITLSGTTLVSAVIRDNKIYIANIGDSRLIVLEKKESKLSVSFSTSDHKLSKKSEAKKIKTKRGEIISMDLGTSKVYRVVSKTGNGQPGLAMSRSIGDKMAHDLGISSYPDIYEQTITESTKYILLASDGLFEFMTNEEIARFLDSSDNIDDTIEELLDESSKRWLDQAKNVDDTTIVIAEL